MKKLSDYQGEAAIELWAELLDPLTVIFEDKDVQNAVRGGGSLLSKAKAILVAHKKEAVQILTIIDPTPVNGISIITRLVGVMREIEDSEELNDFFGSSAQEKKEKESSGSVTAITEVKEN